MDRLDKSNREFMKVYYDDGIIRIVKGKQRTSFKGHTVFCVYDAFRSTWLYLLGIEIRIGTRVEGLVLFRKNYPPK